MIQDHVNQQIAALKAAHRASSIAKAFQAFCQKHPEFAFSSNREFLARFCDENLLDYSQKNFALAATKIPFLLAKREPEPKPAPAPPEPSPLEKRQAEIARLKALSSSELKSEIKSLRGVKEFQPVAVPETAFTADELRQKTPDEIRSIITQAHYRNAH